jgi:hypothetical protein
LEDGFVARRFIAVMRHQWRDYEPRYVIKDWKTGL